MFRSFHVEKLCSCSLVVLRLQTMNNTVVFCLFRDSSPKGAFGRWWVFGFISHCCKTNDLQLGGLHPTRTTVSQFACVRSPGTASPRPLPSLGRNHPILMPVVPFSAQGVAGIRFLAALCLRSLSFCWRSARASFRF